MLPAFIDAMDSRGLWNEDMQEAMLRAEGRINDPASTTRCPRTCARCSSRSGTRSRGGSGHALARACFIDQSQSMELWLERPTTKTLTSMHFYGWKKGLKTGLYYLRSRAKTHSINFSVTHQQQQEECLTCGS